MFTLHSKSEEDTRRLAEDVALALKSGDLLLLSGDLGAGKTVFSRAIIRKLADDPELEVPSPTYTICQTYNSRIPISHFDLYRLSGIDELDELGWEEFLEQGAAIMEWPQNCFDVVPDCAVTVAIENNSGDQREISFSGNADLLSRIERSLEIRTFLSGSNLPTADRQFLLGDASVRSYETINSEMILMNAPEMPDGPIIKDGKPYSKIAHLAENVTAFVAVDELLREQGFKAPEIYARDLDKGLLLTEHLGTAGIIDEDRKPIPERYFAAAELLSHLHIKPAINSVELNEGVRHVIPPYDRQSLLAEVDLLIQWYMPHCGRAEPDQEKYFEIWNELIDELERHPVSMVMRDYHSPNIIWNEEGEGTDRIGLIDFQDAVIGPQSYDVASLAQDARVNIDEALEAEIVERYLAKRSELEPGFDDVQFKAGYAIMAAQRATKLLGIFVRLNVRDGKPNYLEHLPRAKNYLARALRHPVLQQYREWVSTVIEV